MRYKYSEVKEYISMDFQMSMKSIIIALLILIDSLGVPAIFFVKAGCTNKTFLNITLYVFLVLTIFLNLWGSLIIIKKLNMQFLLFSGSLCVSLSLLHLRLFYDVLYNIIGNLSMMFFYIALIAYISIICIWFIWLKHALKSGYFSGKKKKSRTNYFIIASSAFFGVVGFRVTSAIGNETAKHILAAICFLLLSYVTIFVSHNFYKYFLIKKMKADA